MAWRAMFPEAASLPTSNNLVETTRSSSTPCASPIIQPTRGLPEPLVIEQDRKKGPTRAVYWCKVQGGERRVQAQHAVRQLRWNIDRVPADATWITFL